MEDQNINIKLTVQTDKAVQNLEDLKKSADKAANSVEKVSDAGKDVDKAIPTVNGLGDAWEQVFDNVTEALGPTGASLKKIFTSVKAAIPTIKTLNSTAVTGLKGIKAAIASTGIGLLILAVGELAAHWEDLARITNSRSIGKEAQEDYNNLVGESESRIKDVNTLLERQRKVMEANGASQIELAEFDIQASKRREEAYLRQVDIMKASYGRNEITKKQLKEQAEVYTELINAEKDKRRELENTLITVKDVTKAQEARSKWEEDNAKREKAGKDKVEQLKLLKEELQAMTGDAWSTLTRLSEAEGEGLIKSTKGYFTKLLDPKTATQDTDKVVKHIQEAFNELNSALGTELKVTTDIYDGLLEGDRFKNSLNFDKLTAQRESLFAEGKISLEENLKAELKIEEWAFKQEEALLLKRKAFLEENGSGQDLEETLAQLDILRSNWTTFQANQNAAIQEESLNPVRKALESAFKDQESLLKDQEQKILDIRNPFKLSKEYEKNQLAQIENLKNYYQELYDIEIDPDVKDSILESLQDLETQKTEIERQGLEERKQIRIEEIQSYADAANSIADIFGTVAEIEEERIQRQLDAGDIGIEAAKSQFETVKQWQYAQTWINTIAGMTAALTAPSLQSNPAGWVAAATQAASLLATGIAQTIKIKNTQFGGGGVSSGGSGITTSPSVTPIDVRNDIQQSPTVLPDSQSPRNQRVYILERDIQDSNRRVEIRENNSTF